MKACKRCHLERDESMFHRNGSLGRHTVCKICVAEKNRLERQANLDEVRAAERAKHQINKEKRNAQCRAYDEQNKASRAERARIRYRANAETIKANAASYRAANKDRIYEWNGTRRAVIRRAMPVWADRGAIRQAYRLAKQKTAETGCVHHVDHEVPLAHPLVCGLHVPANLRVILAVENMSKSNSFRVGS